MLTVFHSIHFQTTTFSDTTNSHHTATNYYEEPKPKVRQRNKDQGLALALLQSQNFRARKKRTNSGGFILCPGTDTPIRLLLYYIYFCLIYNMYMIYIVIFYQQLKNEPETQFLSLDRDRETQTVRLLHKTNQRYAIKQFLHPNL